MLKFPPDGFFKPVRTFWRSGEAVLKHSGSLANLSLGISPNVTDGINIPSSGWNPAFGLLPRRAALQRTRQRAIARGDREMNLG
jgi:hypothetical protein